MLLKLVVLPIGCCKNVKIKWKYMETFSKKNTNQILNRNLNPGQSSKTWWDLWEEKLEDDSKSTAHYSAEIKVEQDQRVKII